MWDDPTSPSSRCTSPDLHGYTTASEEQDADYSSSSGSNRTVRDPLTPTLRPGAITVHLEMASRRPQADRQPPVARDLKRRHPRGDVVKLSFSANQ